MSKRLMGLALCLALVFTAALSLAEDCFTIDVDTLDMNSLNRDDYVAAHLSAGAQGVRVVKRLSDSSELAVSVRLTLTQMDSGTLLFDKDYGFQSGSFDSGDHLPALCEREHRALPCNPVRGRLCVRHALYASAAPPFL